MKRTIVFIILCLVIAQSLAVAQSAPPLINYQGRLTDENGDPQTGQKTLAFSIYDAATEGTLVWGPQTFENVQLIDGRFNVILGPEDDAQAPIADAFTDGDRFLSISVDGGEAIQPLQQILSVPYAVASSTLNCRPGFWSIADGRICMEETLRGPERMHDAIGICKNVAPGCRVCEHNDFQQACGSGIENPYGATIGWYGDHGFITSTGNWDNEYGTWNRNYCVNDNDSIAYDALSGQTFHFRCCY